MLKIVDESNDLEFSIDDFSVSPVENVVDYNKANDLAEDEIIDYYPTHTFLNPFSRNSVIELKTPNRERYSYIISPPNEIAKVGELLGNNQVNIAMWDSYPSVIKNVSINDITLSRNNLLKVKLAYFTIKVIRAIIPNWYIQKPLKAHYSTYIDRLKIKKKTIFSRLVLFIDSKISNGKQ
jgi:hypothetical protein